MTGDSRERAHAAGRPQLSRRRALALAGVAGATALAGCSVLSGSKEVEIDGAKLADAAASEVPTIIEPLPVSGLEDHAADSRARARAMLDAVPLPLSAAQVPNAVMREQLREEVTEAREALSRAHDPAGLRGRLDALGEARASARSVEAAWAYANDDLSPAAIRSATEQLRADVRQFRRDLEYVGADPVRALLVHAAVESWTRSARHQVERGARGDSEVHNALDVGERAGAVEHGRASLGDARAVTERFNASLSNPDSLRSTFERARDSLASTIESRVADLPGEDAAVSALADADLEGPLEKEAMESLHSDLPHEKVTEREDGPASSLLEQLEALTSVGGFERLRSRIEDGESFTLQRADDVRALRSAAVSAIRDALAASEDRRLARAHLEDLAGWLVHVDREFEQYADDDAVDAESIAWEVSTYLEAEVVAAATPAACKTVRDALEAS